MKNDTIRAVQWLDDKVVLIDQRILPHQEEYPAFSTVAEVAQAIREMVVRGAPAIGVTAAYASILALRESQGDAARFQQLMQQLAAARPTAVNLVWAVERMRQCAESCAYDEATMLEEAHRIHEEDIQANQTMGRLGAELLAADSSVITHCNTGSLATGGYGTALGVIRSAFAEGRLQQVYADETRPWLQGARLTAWELMRDQIPVTLIADSAAAYLMSTKKINWVIVGSDRITANGDVANKIGTYSLAVNARYHGVKFMVVAPTSTIDWSLASGSLIPIEMREKTEVTQCQSNPVAPEGVDALNPAFDVTPAELVDAIVTERGVVLNPTLEKMQKLR